MSDQTKTDRKDIGALWVNESKAGSTYLSGQIDGRRIVVFRNRFKDAGDKKPDYRIFLEEERQPQGETALPVQAQPTRKAATEPSRGWKDSGGTSDDIPF